jgi:hypothetical protein
VAENVTFPQSQVCDQLRHVGGHRWVIHFVDMKRLAVIAQIDAVDFKALGKATHVRMPVFARTEQSMQYEQRRATARPGVIQFRHSFADIGLFGFAPRYFLRGM